MEKYFDEEEHDSAFDILKKVVQKGKDGLSLTTMSDSGAGITRKIEIHKYQEKNNWSAACDIILKHLPVLLVYEREEDNTVAVLCDVDPLKGKFHDMINRLGAKPSPMPLNATDFLSGIIDGSYDPDFYEAFVAGEGEKKQTAEAKSTTANVGLRGIQLAFGALLNKHIEAFGAEETKELLRDCKWSEEMINKTIK